MLKKVAGVTAVALLTAARLGFKEIPLKELSPALLCVIEDEARRGLDPRRRVVMRRPCLLLEAPADGYAEHSS